MFKRFALAFSLWINFFLVFPFGWGSDTNAVEKRMFSILPEKVEEIEVYEEIEAKKNKDLHHQDTGIWVIILGVGGMVLIILGTRFLLRK